MPGAARLASSILKRWHGGIPVVASKADASREAVRNGEIGRLVDPDKPEELKVAILQALWPAQDRRSAVRRPAWNTSRGQLRKTLPPR